MRVRSLMHLSNGVLLSKLDRAEARDRTGTVELLGYLAEVDRRRLYVPAGYSSMFVWCVKARNYSEAMASKRIYAARAVRRFPVILDMIADGRLHLTAVALLSRKLTPGNANELLAAATHRSRREIEIMLAERFPQRDVATRVRALPPASSLPSPGTVKICAADAQSAAPSCEREGAPSATEALAPTAGACRPSAAVERPVSAPAPPAMHSRLAPLAPGRFSIQFTMDEAMHGDLVRAQELLGPQAGEDRVREVFRRALRELVAKLEKQKFAAPARPRAQKARPAGRPVARNPRHVPAGLKRQVLARDGGRCTLVSDSGHRCESREALEIDHVIPVAKGGAPTLANLRLLCRTHNQYEAGQAFGEGFMHEIRERARRSAQERSSRNAAAPDALASPAP